MKRKSEMNFVAYFQRWWSWIVTLLLSISVSTVLYESSSWLPREKYLAFVVDWHVLGILLCISLLCNLLFSYWSILLGIDRDRVLLGLSLHSHLEVEDQAHRNKLSRRFEGVVHALMKTSLFLGCLSITTQAMQSEDNNRVEAARTKAILDVAHVMQNQQNDVNKMFGDFGSVIKTASNNISNSTNAFVGRMNQASQLQPLARFGRGPGTSEEKGQNRLPRGKVNDSTNVESEIEIPRQQALIFKAWGYGDDPIFTINGQPTQPVSSQLPFPVINVPYGTTRAIQVKNGVWECVVQNLNVPVANPENPIEMKCNPL